MRLLRPIVLIALFSKCSDSAGPPAPVVPAAIAISPDSISIRIGQQLQMHAVVLDSAGDTIATASPTWSSSDTAVMTVSNGLVTARNHGTAFVTAHLDTLADSAYLRVLVPVARVTLSPSSVRLVPGGTLQLTASLSDSNGDALSDRDVIWRHQTGAISIASSTSMIKGLVPGEDTVTATSEGVDSWNRTPVSVTQPQFIQVIANSLSQHACGLTATGSAYCWGSNSRGELGNGTFGDSLGMGFLSWPRTTGGLTHATGVLLDEITWFAAGEHQSCAVYGSGQVACWGVNDEYSLGNGPGPEQARPQPVGVPPAMSVVVGDEWACALGTDSIPHCWGGSVTGFLIDPTPFPARKYGAIYAGYKRLCGIGADSLAYCGFPTNNSQQLVSSTLKFTTFTLGYEYGCGIATDSLAYCWGNNDFGQLGDSTRTFRSTPVPVAGSHKFRDLSASLETTCGVEIGTGTGYCWGINLFVPRPPPLTPPEFVTVPSPVPGSLVFSQITGGSRFACGLAAGKAYCWGTNEFGQLGDGTATDRLVPTIVVGQQP
jgi:hypothetical protein